MTYEERTIVRAAINAAKRAWLDQQGGYSLVEKDARCMDQRIVRGGRGDKGRQERARQLRAEGWSFVAIGRELGVHHSTVWGWLNNPRQRAASKAAVGARKARARGLRQDGHTLERISQQTGISVTTAHRWTAVNSKSTEAIGSTT